MQASQEPQTSTAIQVVIEFRGQKFLFKIALNNSSLWNQHQQLIMLSTIPPSAGSVSSNRSPFSPQCSQSYVSDVHHSSDNTYGSPLSGYSGVDDDNKLMHALMVLRNELLGPESEIDDNCSFYSVASQTSSLTRCNQILEMAPNMDLQQVLIACAEAVSESDIATAEALMDILERRVSVSGEPIERLSAYMLEGLRARLLSSGSIIYKKLKCKEITSAELISYMQPWKMRTESTSLISRLRRVVSGYPLFRLLHVGPGGPPYIHITGVDDSQSAHARGGGLELVGQTLAKVAKSCGVPFEFHAAGMSGCEVQLENLQVRNGEALAVNFPYMLHHMPDESVSTMNHRDRLLRLVKSLSPKVVTLVEQESNTNTAPFFQRFCETLDYYTAMFESIDAARSREDKQRINAEEHCVARDVVNIIACEDTDRVERHELFGKWRLRLMMAGFSPIPLSQSVSTAIRDMLNEYSPNYRLAESNGALYLGWKNRAMATSSAWR
ncbi:SCARECROW-like 13 [Abeliophyllum distichum]|uniref:SCARECROW-like 13 n=2 Tax=Abeliophyllum distichum TaxID=126358 RepID=A0ABD1QHN7_9LAMI